MDTDTTSPDILGFTIASRNARGRVVRLGPALEVEDAEGMSPAKRFFYKYAQGWCTAATDAELAKVVKEDGHALPEYRTNGPLSNLPGFGRAFACKAGDPMMRRREDICRVW